MPDARGFSTPDARGRRYCHRCDESGAWLPIGTDLVAHANLHDLEESIAHQAKEQRQRQEALRRLLEVNQLRAEGRR